MFNVLHCLVVNKGVFLLNFAVVLQVAMLLHKLRPQKNPYYFWAVMSIVMQASISVLKIFSFKYL